LGALLSQTLILSDEIRQEYMRSVEG
jgi:hypothetical protein